MISVIIPVHNGIRTLDRAVESVLRQSYRAGGGSLEIILVDDGSRKETARHCDELAEDNMRRPDGAIAHADEESGKSGEASVRVFHMEDRGVSAARNLGLEQARGEFITFLDDDDAMEPGMLEYLVGLQEKTGADICGCGFRKVLPGEMNSDGSGERCGQEESRRSEEQQVRTREGRAGGGPGLSRNSSGWEVYRGAEIVTKRILHRDTRVWSKLFTRETIGAQGFLEGLTIGEDMLFVLSLVRDDTVYAAGDAALYDYTINPRGAMERPFTRSYMDQIRCWDEAERVIRKNLPEILSDGRGQETEAAAQLGALRVVSDILTASKIAKLPDSEWNEYQPEFGMCRAKLREHRRIPGSRDRIPRDYRWKAVLLEHFPELYRSLYRRRQQS